MINVGAVVLNHCDKENALNLAELFLTVPVINHILIVDNSQTGALSGTEKIFSSTKVELLLASNDGYAKGNNRGVNFLEEKYGQFQYFIISNPDVIITPESVMKCIIFLEQNMSYVLVAPHMYQTNGLPNSLTAWKERTIRTDLAYCSGILSRILGMGREKYPQNYWQSSYSTVDCVSGAFFVVNASAFKRAGYFDEKTFLFFEEDILCYKMKTFGYKCAIINECSFVHKEGVSMSVSLRKYITMQKSRIYFYRVYKKCNLWSLILLYIVTFIGIMETGFKTLVKLRS